eukprot:gene9068-1163_t
MGNDLSVDTATLSIKDFKNCPKSQNYKEFQYNIKCWEFQKKNCKSINFDKFTQFSEFCSYIILSLYKKKTHQHSENDEEDERELSELSRGSRSLFELCHDATNNLTPRGLTIAFNECKKFEGASFEIFLWNGKSTTTTTKVNCLANGYELEKLLKYENIENIMSMGAPVSIMTFFKNDVENASSLYSPNLYKDLCHDCTLVDSLLKKKTASEIETISTLFDFFNLKNKTSLRKQLKKEPDSPEKKDSATEFDLPPPGGAEQVAYYRKICSQIREDLFLGSDFVARSKELLQENGVTHIVNAAKVACDNYFPKDFQYCALNLYDSPTQSIIGLFFVVIKFMNDAIKNGGKVYVHCYAGVSRSSSIVVSYLMWKEKSKCRELLENVKKRRAVSSPNAGFTVQLFRWEKILLQQSEETYMYRMSPLNDRYAQHKQTGPQLCYVAKLDSRTCFILQTFEGKIFIWNGSKRKENLTQEAIAFAKLIEEFLDGIDNNFIMIEEGKETKEFNDALSKVAVMKALVNQAIPYPELDYFDKEITAETPEKVNIAPIVEEEIEEEDLESLKSNLYVYPDWELLTTFDSEDLEDDQVLVLEPLNDDKIYVWVGEDTDYKAVDIGKKFINELEKSTELIIVTVQSGDEPDDFWKYFVNG